MLSFHQIVEADFAAVNDTIVSELHSDVDLVENIGHYIVDAGGKRLRPLLALLVAKSFGYTENNHVTLAAIIEFIHTATLLHDDVVDISALRRGRATANAKWGNAPSVLVGDFLYSRAFQMLVAIGDMDIMSVVSDATNLIAEGEVQQLVNAKNPEVTEDNYLEVIHKKTAVLFEAACETAAVISNCSPEQRTSAKRYGYHLGIAFQLIDDALDYNGDAESLGKNVGDDLAEGKPTLPLIYTMANSDADTAQLIRHGITNSDVDKLSDIIVAVRSNGGLNYTHDKAKQHVAEAIECLDSFPSSPYKKVLSELADFSVSRTY